MTNRPQRPDSRTVATPQPSVPHASLRLRTGLRAGFQPGMKQIGIGPAGLIGSTKPILLPFTEDEGP